MRVMLKHVVSCVSFLILGCHFSKEKMDKESLYQDEIRKIDFSIVDNYPSTSFCDTIEDQCKQRTCFTEYLSNFIKERLANDTLDLPNFYPDTLSVQVIIYPDSRAVIHPLFKSSFKDSLIIKQLFDTNFDHIPDLLPATKRGIKVKSVIQVPIVFKKLEDSSSVSFTFP